MAPHVPHGTTGTASRPEVHARLLRRRRTWLRGELSLAADFAEILASRHFAEADCVSLAEYARKIGYDGTRAWRLARLGLALRLEPDIRVDLERGRTSFENALRLPDAILDPQVRNARDWRAEAAARDEKGLRRVIREARERRALGTDDLRHIEILTPEVGRDNWRRLKYLVEAKVGRALTDGQLFLWVTEYVLEHLDPLRRAMGLTTRPRLAARGSVDTPGGAEPSEAAQQERASTQDSHAGDETGSRGGQDHLRDVPNPRRITALMLDELRARARGCCEVSGCDREGPLEVMHLTPVGDEAPDDLRTLALGCHRHRVLFDAGRLRQVGFGPDGSPIFQDRHGHLLAPRAPPPPRLPPAGSTS